MNQEILYITAFQNLFDTVYSSIDPRTCVNSLIVAEELVNKEQSRLPYMTHDQLLVQAQELCGTEGISVTHLFHRLQRSLEEILVEINSLPHCAYDHIFTWRNLSRELGEDFLVCLYLAGRDRLTGSNRDVFTWSLLIRSDNQRIKQVLRKGMSENHFHLGGSAPIFELSWVQLMNHCRTAANQERLRKVEKESLMDTILPRGTRNPKSLYLQLNQAVLIRAYLYSKLLGEPFTQDQSVAMWLLSEKEESLIEYMPQIEEKIEAWQFLHTLNGGKIVVDYCIPVNPPPLEDDRMIWITGERRFLYQCFKRVLHVANGTTCPDWTEQDSKFLHLYILIKNRLRGEMIQLNKRCGFANFKDYQDRKGWFIPQKTVYSKLMGYAAIQGSLQEQNIKNFEARIAPRNSKAKMRDSIIGAYEGAFTYPMLDQLEQWLQQYAGGMGEKEKQRSKLFFVIHFLKTTDDKIGKIEYYDIIHPRHHQNRVILKRQAESLVQARRDYPEVMRLCAGIDAASSEIGCRPEVFAQAFRFIRHYAKSSDIMMLHAYREKAKQEYMGQGSGIQHQHIWITFHAGEDYLSLTDGLRAMDEALRFLDMKRGDRIGHGLALGMDPKLYYKKLGYKITLPLQDLFDNLVWMHGVLREWGIGDHHETLTWLNSQYVKYRAMLHATDNSCIEDYFEAWKLRDIDPLYFKERKQKKTGESALSFWEKCAEPLHRKYTNWSSKASELYVAYHFDHQVKKAGLQSVTIEVPYHYIKALQDVQKKQQRIIVEKGIGIETNPSSNYLIGRFGQYKDHPILRLYNLGLERDPVKLKECPQMFVSINTDDQGVFQTLLENEYALMAAALEQERDDDGNLKYHPEDVYEWIDRVREMGNQQSWKIVRENYQQ